jgi:hypothetical protein
MYTGIKTELSIDTLPTQIIANENLVRSVRHHELVEAKGARLRAAYVFRNRSGSESHPVFAHRLGSPEFNPEANVLVKGVQVLVKGLLMGRIRFAGDPHVRLRLLFPWDWGEDSLDGYLEEVFNAARVELGADDLTMRAVQSAYNRFLPREPLDWQFTLPQNLEGDEDRDAVFQIGLEATTPGITLFALQVEDAENPAIKVCSDILALEVTPEGEINLLSEVEPEDESELVRA